MPLDILQRVWVTATVLLISFIAYSSQIFIIYPWYGRVVSMDLLKVLVPFNLIVGMIFWNYYLCVTTPPGSIPPGWTPDPSTLQAFEVKRLSHGPRFCKSCEVYKPPRAHHCRQCKACVLKMDHHCPWIANCVGFYNQAHFIRFLIWVDIGTSYHLMMMVYRIRDMADWTYEPTLLDILMLVLNLATCVPVWLAVGIFSIYHVYCAVGNSTTIEGWEKDRVATLVRRGKIRHMKYPYDIGFVKNLQSVLGPNPLLWLWPQSMRGDGLSFPVSLGLGDPSDAHLWPYREPTRTHVAPDRVKNGNAFTFGGSALNPDLRPSNGTLRSRENSKGEEPHQGWVVEDQLSSGEERDRDSVRRSSSPEAFLSDMDEEGDDIQYGDDDDDRRVRVRQGSEGYEVAPKRDWVADVDVQQPQLPWQFEDGRKRMPWEEQGRYNVYDPGDVYDTDSE